MGERAINVLSLCSGGLGLDLGLELVLPGARIVCGVEWEAFACAVMEQMQREGSVAPFPVWSDLRTFDGTPWRGVVDCVTAGYPCQPFSQAGSRRGSDDPRHLWPHVARVIAEVQPGIVFLENVPGHLTLGYEQVRAELQGLGFGVTEGLFSAEEVGAPHRRERLFILGVADAGFGSNERRGRPEDDDGPASRIEGEAQERKRGGDDARGGGGTVADGGGERSQRIGEAGPEARAARRGAGELGNAECSDPWRGDEAKQGRAGVGRCGLANTGTELADGEGRGFGELWDEAQQGNGGHADGAGGAVGNCDGVGRWPESHFSGKAELAYPDGPHARLFPPGPNDLDAWSSVAPEAQPAVRGMADGLAVSRRQWLRLLGNGVCPLAAAYAFASLWALRS